MPLSASPYTPVTAGHLGNLESVKSPLRNERLMIPVTGKQTNTNHRLDICMMKKNDEKN